METFKTLVVNGFKGFGAAAAGKALGLFGSAVACLQAAYSQVGTAVPDLKSVADSLSASASAGGAGDVSFLLAGAIFSAVSYGVGYAASKLPIWGAAK